MCRGRRAVGALNLFVHGSDSWKAMHCLRGGARVGLLRNRFAFAISKCGQGPRSRDENQEKSRPVAGPARSGRVENALAARLRSGGIECRLQLGTDRSGLLVHLRAADIEHARMSGGVLREGETRGAREALLA
jgi:hypothetical protein